MRHNLISSCSLFFLWFSSKQDNIESFQDIHIITFEIIYVVARKNLLMTPMRNYDSVSTHIFINKDEFWVSVVAELTSTTKSSNCEDENIAHDLLSIFDIYRHFLVQKTIHFFKLQKNNWSLIFILKIDFQMLCLVLEYEAFIFFEFFLRSLLAVGTTYVLYLIFV